MAEFDFPQNPSVGQAYTAAGQTYVWNGYAWVGGVAALPPAGSVSEAPNDGVQYSRQSESWTQISWAGLAGVPATFPAAPHTHPVGQISDSTPVGQALVTAADQAAGRTAIAAISEDDVARVTVLDGGVLTGSRRQLNFIEGDNVTILVVDDAANERLDITVATSGGGGGGASVLIADTPPDAPPNSLWWESDTGGMFIRFDDGNTTQWVQVNAQPGSIGEAPLDGQSYERKSGGWAVAGSGAGGGISEAPQDSTVYGRINAGWTRVLPLAGGTLSGALAVNGAINNTYSGASYAIQGNNLNGGGGGVIGFAASIYGIAGYAGYSFYGNGPLNVGAGTFTSLACNVCTFNVATTTSSATAYLATSGGFYRSTSSEIFKADIEDITPDYADRVLSLRTVFYRPNEKTVDPQDWSRFGFLTENAYETDFRFTSCSPVPLRPITATIPDPLNPEESIEIATGEFETTEEVVPSDIDLKAVVACLLDVVRRQGERIAALEAR